MKAFRKSIETVRVWGMVAVALYLGLAINLAAEITPVANSSFSTGTAISASGMNAYLNTYVTAINALIDLTASQQTAIDASMGSGFVNRGEFVTLGNLKVCLPTGGTFSLQVATGSGTLTLYGAEKYMAGVPGGYVIDGSAPLTVTTTPVYLHAPDDFGTGGGQVDEWLLRDRFSPAAWRITLIVGIGGNSNFISIEKLK